MLKKLLPLFTALGLAGVIALMNITFLASAGGYVPPPDTPCEDSYGSDGYFYVCKDTEVYHSGAAINIIANNVNEREVKLEFENAERENAIVKVGETVTVSTSYESMNLDVRYAGYNPEYGAILHLTSESSMSCGNSAGGDGLYVACAGDVVKHNPTGVKALVDWFDGEIMKVTLSGAMEDELFIKLDDERKTYDVDAGHETVRFIYERSEGDPRAYLMIEGT